MTNMADIIKLKKEADELMKIPGDTKGSEFLTLRDYIKEKYGEKKVRLLEESVKKLGYDLEFDKIDPLKWYPEALNILGILVAKELFNWTPADIFKFGNASPKFSFGVRLFVKLVSLKKVFEEVGKSWNKFMKVGILEPYIYDEKKKYLILRLKNYRFHPIMCHYFAGFFLRFPQYVMKSKKITIKETACPYKGGAWHEYLVKWE